MRGLKIIFNVVISLLFSYQAFAIGYVSRDCPLLGAKESITMDWSGKGEWFYTESYQFLKDGQNKYKIVKFTSGGWDKTWRSYAGKFLSLENVYEWYTGVYGYHYRYNLITKQTEFRAAFVTTCNSLTWGYDNW